MKNILKSIIVLLVTAMVLVGCGNTNTPDTEKNTQQTESSVTDQDEETSSATSESTEITAEIETEVQTEVKNETQAESEVPSEPEAPTYTYTDMDKTMYAKSSVNVRNLPSTDGEKLGGLSKAQEVHVTGQCNETSWYRIDYNGGVAYVSNSYLVNDKPVEETPAPEPEEPTQPSQPETSMTLDDAIAYASSKYPLYQVVDNGDANVQAYILVCTGTLTTEEVQKLNELGTNTEVSAATLLYNRGYGNFNGTYTNLVFFGENGKFIVQRIDYIVTTP